MTRPDPVTLGVAVDFSLPTLTGGGGAGFAGPAVTTVLDATYYDAADLRLTRAGAMVRHRNDEGWRVHRAGTEHHFRGTPWEPPTEAVDLVRSLQRSAELGAVARLRTTRCTIQLHDDFGQVVAVVDDDDVERIAGEVHDDVDVECPHFREITLSFRPDATDGQRQTILARLHAAGAAPGEDRPKLIRALGRAATAPADLAVTPWVANGVSIATVLGRALATSTAALVAHDPGVRLDDDPESLHQARVATRRLRSTLRVFRPLVDERWVTDLRTELDWLAETLGAVRDADVLLDRFTHDVGLLGESDQATGQRLLDTLRRDRARHHELLLVAMQSSRYAILLDLLAAAAQRPRLLLPIDDTDDVEVLRGLVRAPLRHLRRAVAAAPPTPTDETLHKLRILTKRARYAIEAVSVAFGRRARGHARGLARLQDVLGAHHDTVVATAWLREQAGLDPTVGLVAGQLMALERERAATAAGAWHRQWRAANRKQLRSWL